MPLSMSFENYIEHYQILLFSGDGGDPVVICCNSIQNENVVNLCHYYMSMCRRYGLLRNERTTLLSAMDQLITLQLCLAEKNKQVIR